MGWLIGFGIFCATVTVIVSRALDFTERVTARDYTPKPKPDLDPVEPEPFVDPRRERRKENVKKWRRKAEDVEFEAMQYLDNGQKDLHALMLGEAAKFRKIADEIDAADATNVPPDTAHEKQEEERHRFREREEKLDAAVTQARKRSEPS